MKLSYLLGVLFFTSLVSCSSQKGKDGWRLVWEDEFEGTAFDTATWSKIPR